MKSEPDDDFRIVAAKIIYFLGRTWQPLTVGQIAKYVDRDLEVTTSYCDLLRHAGRIKKVQIAGDVGFLLID
jgi:hypothetical protein